MKKVLIPATRNSGDRVNQDIVQYVIHNNMGAY